MSKLFIYYSHSGNGDKVAEYLSARGVQTRKIERKKKLPKNMFGLMMTGGFLAGIKYKDKVLDYDKNIASYDEIIIGSPIWNGRIACPINTVLSELDLSGKKVVFIFYSGSGEAFKAVMRIHKEYPDAIFYILKEPKQYVDQLSSLDNLF